ncbi:MAG: hypothetical protein RI841_12320, partial [Halomonas sp.]|uniref:hypothetical protein n=1 Tax=Halomonas sp. TaxID=1486246 RepID=UPI0028705B7D
AASGRKLKVKWWNWNSTMALIRSGRDAPRRGASCRRQRCRFDRACFDRWLDRVVVVAVSIALLVGVVALVLTLLL